MIELQRSTQRWPYKLILRRIAWGFFQPLMLLPFKQLSFLRVLLLRFFGASIGSNCLILPGVKVLMPWNLCISDFVAIGQSVEIYNFATVHVNRMSVISQRCFLCTGSHDYTKSNMPLTWNSICIGSECWVAAEVFIAPGVTIENGVVIGARSVVTRPINSPWSVWAGNPAKLIKARHMKDDHEA